MISKISGLLITVLIFSLALASSCTYDNEKELFKDTLVGCDTIDVSYKDDILPILQNNCYECHAASVATAGIILEGYDNVKEKADDGRLVGVTSRLPGFPQMPFGRPKLPACELLKIKKWVEAGAPNN